MPGQPTAPPLAVIDACVLYPASTRGVLLSLADEKLFRPVWSQPILDEVRGSLLRDRAMSAGQWRHLNRELDLAFPQAMAPVADIRAIEPSMPNHPKDRHVLAAAVVSGAPAVVTTNLRDFQPADLAKVGVQAIHPDAYLVGLLERSPNAVARALENHVADMRGDRRWSPEQLLGHFKGLGQAAALAPRFAEQAERSLGVRAVAPPPRIPRESPSRAGRSRQAALDAASLGR
jgi:hypothetical protein